MTHFFVMGISNLCITSSTNYAYNSTDKFKTFEFIAHFTNQIYKGMNTSDNLCPSTYEGVSSGGSFVN